ncbi:MAG: DAK2 domain-containing protein [Clostridia bacterium]|nr:DAK2 domain-containing protein [Clostridia bacterium]
MKYNGNVIDGELFEKMVLGGAVNLHDHVKTVNDLNVFPIPDGDTGENMFLTMRGGVEGLKKAQDESLAEKASALANGMLMGARGNSGVILSQLFYGLAEGLKGHERADLKDFGLAIANGVKCAYGAVAVPVEGTILTVARESAENTADKITDDISVYEFFKLFLREMKESLDRTPELLAVLKEAGVIDSGGAGLVYIIEGFCKALSGEELILDDINAQSKTNVDLDFSKFTEDSVMEYGYCTEMLLQLQRSKTDIDSFSVEALIKHLESIGGDSIVAFRTGTVIKIHVHTMTPYKVLEYCQRFGEYLTVKIENMTLQHNETVGKKKNEGEKEDAISFKKPRKKFATVTTAMGQGLIDLFEEMGADVVVNGGQTNNPSAEDFLKAFDEANAENIFVLPNNSNIILSAKQAKELYDKANIYIIESKSIGQGYSAISELDYSSDDPDIIAQNLAEAMQSSTTAMVARSIRKTVANGVSIEENDYMGFTGKTMLYSTKSKLETTKKLIEKFSHENEFLIMVYGKTTTDEEKEEIQAYVESLGTMELYEVDGMQEVYDFILIFE